MKALVVLAAGACGGWAFLPGGPGWLFFVCYAPLLWVAIEEATVLRALLWGWLAGTAAWGVGIHWLPGTISHFMGAPYAVGLLMYAGYCVCHGLMAGLWTAAVRALAPSLARRLGGRPYAAAALVAAPALAVVDGYFPQQFPIRLAISQYWHLPLLQSLDLFGCAATVWLGGGVNAAVYSVARSWRLEGRPRLGVAAVMAACLALNEAYGLARMRWADSEAARARAEGRAIDVGVVQAAIPIDAKQKKERFKGNLAAHRRLTEALLAERPDLDLVIWPETSYERRVRYARGPDGLPREPTIEGEPLQAFLGRELPARAPLLISAIGEVPEADPSARPQRYNTALLTGREREFMGLVEKTHLLPFGEYMPLGRVFPRLHALSPRTWRLSRGERQRTLEAPGPSRLGVLICYEVALPGFVRAYARMGADLLVNLSNDAWLYAVGADQHLRVSALRSIETRRYLVRAVNSGVSAVVDPAGRTVARLGFGQEGHLAASVALLDSRTAYMRIGDLAYRLAAAMLLALALWCYKRGAWRRTSAG